MKYLEPILRFLVTLIRVIFPKREPSPSAPSGPAHDSVPDVPHPPLPSDAGDRGYSGRRRRDSVPAGPTSQVLNITGCCLMAAGGIGCILKYLL